MIFYPLTKSISFIHETNQERKTTDTKKKRAVMKQPKACIAVPVFTPEDKSSASNPSQKGATGGTPPPLFLALSAGELVTVLSLK